MFEKYDGVRGFWNPLKKAFYSRLGNQIPFPKEITHSMPQDLFLDGELWYIFFLFSLKPLNNAFHFFSCLFRFGRNNFSEASKLSARAELSKIDWRNFRYMVYDIPKDSGTYAERYNKLGKQFFSFFGLS